MRDMFPEHFPMSEQIRDQLWAEAVIVFDTNVLMDIHAWRREQAEWFLDQCEQRLKSRLWLPNQVAREFSRNRIVRLKARQKVITDNLNVLTSQAKQVKDKSITALEQALVPVDATTFPDIEGVINGWLGDKVPILEADRAELNRREKLVDDDIFERIENLYAQRIGDAYPPARERELYEEGAKRYGGLTPPGFGDKKDEEYRLYGDFFVWQQMLEQASSHTIKGIIFVTNDVNKNDWFVDRNPKQPHPELLREFRMRLPGKSIIICNLKDFMYSAEKKGLIVGHREYEQALLQARRDAEEREFERTRQEELIRDTENRWQSLQRINNLLSHSNVVPLHIDGRVVDPVSNWEFITRATAAGSSEMLSQLLKRVQDQYQQDTSPHILDTAVSQDIELTTNSELLQAWRTAEGQTNIGTPDSGPVCADQEAPKDSLPLLETDDPDDAETK